MPRNKNPRSLSLLLAGTCWVLLVSLAAMANGQAAPPDQETLLRLLADQDPKAQCEAAEALQKATPAKREALVEVAEAVKSALAMSRDASAQRALRLAL